MKRKSTTNTLRAWLVEGDTARIRTYAQGQRRLLSFLTALTYDPDPLISWRAIHAMQVAASEIAGQDPEYVRIHLRRLMWLLTDESGGIGWRAPEAMGALIAACPQACEAFVPILVSILDMEAEDAVRFRAGALWAIGHLAPILPEQLGRARTWLPLYFSDPDPQVRGMAVWAHKRCSPHAAGDKYQSLTADRGSVIYLVDGNVTRTSVAELAR